MKKKIIYGAIVIILLFILVGLMSEYLKNSKDENIENYKTALTESIYGDTFHYTQTVKTLTVDGSWVDGYNIEYYKNGKDKLIIEKYENFDWHMFFYKGYTYEATIYEKAFEIQKRDGYLPMIAEPKEIDASYYLIYDENVIYEETETQYIVAYENKSLVGEKVRPWLEDDDSVYTVAKSIAYFDKEWKIQKIEFTQSYEAVAEDGREYEAVVQTTLVYHQTPESEYKRIFEEEYTLLETLNKKED